MYFTNGVFLFLLSILLSILVIVIKNNKQELKKIIFLILVTIFCVDLPYLISSSAFNAGRTHFAIGALCSTIIIYILCKLKHNNKKNNKKVYLTLYTFIIIYFVLNVTNYVEIIINAKIANNCEKEYVQNIEQYIDNFEKENNASIEKIQLVRDSKTTNIFFAKCTRRNVMTWNACACPWSAVGTINFYANRNLTPLSNDFVEIKMDEFYKIIDNVLYVKVIPK